MVKLCKPAPGAIPGCFGNFDKTRIICLSHCSLRLSCAVEMDRMACDECLEDLAGLTDHAVMDQ